jgi:RsiW-degrading membrane proteinase PrsW (M82 family)
VPGILWVWYFYKKDRYDPEPKRLIVRDFIWGILIVFPVSAIEGPFSGFLEKPGSLLVLFLASVFIVGLVEEGAKSLIIYLLHFNHPEFNESIDGIIYGVTVGLGFAAAENLFYTMMFGYKVGIVRAFLTTLAHASFSGIFGYFLGRAKIDQLKSYIPVGFGMVVFMHGLYDFLVISQIMGIFYTILTIISLQIYLAYLINKLLKRSPFKNK